MPRNWDEHYADRSRIDLTPEPLLVEASDQLAPGEALDLACGPGRNALHLARLGWRVTAVDRSPVAIQFLQSQIAGLAIDARKADLEQAEFVIAPQSYDLICNFLFLQRNLFASIREGVRPGGLFAAGIPVVDDSGAAPHNLDFLLQPGELRTLFDGWKILFYSEGQEPGRSRRNARILARRA